MRVSFKPIEVAFNVERDQWCCRLMGQNLDNGDMAAAFDDFPHEPTKADLQRVEPLLRELVEIHLAQKIMPALP